MRCGFWIFGFTYQISGHSQGFFRNTVEMPHSVSPRLTVYCAGAEGLIASAVGAAAVWARVPDCSSAWMAASVAVSWASGAAAGPASAAGAVGSSMGRECPKKVEQPPSDSAAATKVTDRPGRKAWLKVILPSSAMGGGQQRGCYHRLPRSARDVTSSLCAGSRADKAHPA